MTTQDHTAALLPCPFCGGAAEALRKKPHLPFTLATCADCQFTLPIDAWNTRAHRPAASEARAVPVVPVAPTIAMLEAAQKYQRTEYVYDEYQPLKLYADIYRVMLQAANLPPSIMVDMSPPATARDRWMYEQGRLAERDPRSHAAPPAQPEKQAGPSDAEVMKLYAETVAEFSDGRGFDAGTVAFARVLLRRYAAAQPEKQAPVELAGIAEVMAEGDGFWRSCTGCHELNEGHDTGPYSEILKCHLGNGCRECGGIGAIWDTTDYQAMADALETQPEKQAAQDEKLVNRWECATRISEIPAVDEALETFANDTTRDNGIGVVAAVLEALAAPPAPADAGADTWKRLPMSNIPHPTKEGKRVVGFLLDATDAEPGSVAAILQTLIAPSASSQQAAPAAEPDAKDTLAQLYDIFSIGAQARQPHILVENVRNSYRRSRCLSAVECVLSVPVPPEPEDDGVWGEESLLNWGASPEGYADHFKAALAEFQQQAAPAAEPLHITHGPLMREAAALLRFRRPVTPDVERVAAELETALEGKPTPAGAPSKEWLAVAEQTMAEAAHAAESAEPLEPVDGDVLPPIGERVEIHLASIDKWVPHTVAGYYVWGDLGGNASLHRVFVRVRSDNGYLNARLLKDIRRDGMITAATADAQGDERADLQIGVAVAANEGTTVCILQRHGDGSATVIYSQTHPVGDSIGHATLARQQGGGDALTDAARDVLAERQRQISVEGWHAAEDDNHEDGQMAAAAACYAMFTQAYPPCDPVQYWPWDKSWWKPSTPRRNLVKAGALILAEIERLDRAALAAAKPEGGK